MLASHRGGPGSGFDSRPGHVSPETSRRIQTRVFYNQKLLKIYERNLKNELFCKEMLFLELKVSRKYLKVPKEASNSTVTTFTLSKCGSACFFLFFLWCQVGNTYSYNNIEAKKRKGTFGTGTGKTQLKGIMEEWRKRTCRDFVCHRKGAHRQIEGHAPARPGSIWKNSV